MNEKRNVALFKEKFQLRLVSVETITAVIEKQGFTIIPFNSLINSTNVKTLIEGLHLQEYVISCKCFTYQDDKYRLLFINEELSDEEKLIVLAHEEGHIWHDHLVKDSIFGADVKQEYQANEFAHYLLKDPKQKKQKLLSILLLLCFICIVTILSISYIKIKRDKEVYTDNYYRTSSGTKYHLQDCIYIQDKSNVVKLTREEFESDEYEPCSVCIRFESEN